MRGERVSRGADGGVGGEVSGGSGREGGDVTGRSGGSGQREI